MGRQNCWRNSFNDNGNDWWQQSKGLYKYATEIFHKTILAVQARLGGSFHKTTETQVIKYQKTMMKYNTPKWEQAADEEHNCFVTHKAFTEILQKDMLEAAKMLTFICAIKKKKVNWR